MGLITYDNLEDGTPVTANVFNERFAQIVAQLNGNIDETNLADEGISKEKLQTEVYESLYPVGSMYVNFTDDTNPATLLGFGVWTAVAGRTVVGYDGTQTEFNAAEKTGGTKTHTLTKEELPAVDIRVLGTGMDDFANFNSGGSNGGWSAINMGANNGVGRLRLPGGGQAHNILQPYITGYMWKRTS